MASPSSGDAPQTGGYSTPVSPNNDEAALVSAVQQLPTGLLMMVDSSFQNYRGGVYTYTTCTTAVNHAMLLVGMDQDTTTGQWYWLVKNSWGTGWGESGFIRIKMTGSNGAGMCGMYQWAWMPPTSFPSPTMV